jgi:hypothetical protein
MNTTDLLPVHYKGSLLYLKSSVVNILKELFQNQYIPTELTTALRPIEYFFKLNNGDALIGYMKKGTGLVLPLSILYDESVLVEFTIITAKREVELNAFQIDKIDRIGATRQYYFEFRNERKSLSISLKTGDLIHIKKFISLNDLNFVTAPTLSFQVSGENIQWPMLSFLGLLEHNQYDVQLVETEFIYGMEHPGTYTINIINPDDKIKFHLNMLYNIESI